MNVGEYILHTSTPVSPVNSGGEASKLITCAGGRLVRNCAHCTLLVIPSYHLHKHLLLLLLAHEPGKLPLWVPFLIGTSDVA